MRSDGASLRGSRWAGAIPLVLTG